MTLKKIPQAMKLQAQIGSLFAHLPFSANQLTLSSVLFAAIGFLFSLQQQVFPSLAFFVLAGALDAIDGAVARAKKQVSDKGAYIDGITDRLVEFLFILSLLAYSLPNLAHPDFLSGFPSASLALLPDFILPAWLSLMCFLFFGSAMTGFATAYAEHRHVADAKKIAAQPGMLPRAERLILLFAAMLLIPFAPLYSSALLFTGAVLSAITFFQRFRYFAG